MSKRYPLRRGASLAALAALEGIDLDVALEATGRPWLPKVDELLDRTLLRDIYGSKKSLT